MVLPDFITEKYPQYGKLRERGFFQEVSLFPYLRLPHQSRDQVYRDALRLCRETLPRPLSRYEKIYVAGAHFYFSLALLQEGIPFTMLEDAAGMLARGRELYENLAQRYPLHGEIAWGAGLFTGENPLIREVICLKEAQGGTVPPKCRDFSVEIALERLDPKTRKAVAGLFVPWPLWSRAEGILLTQHLAPAGPGHLGGPAPGVLAAGPGAFAGGAAAGKAPPRRPHGLPGDLPPVPCAAAALPGGAASLRFEEGAPGGVHLGLHQLPEFKTPLHHRHFGEGSLWDVRKRCLWSIPCTSCSPRCTCAAACRRAGRESCS